MPKQNTNRQTENQDQKIPLISFSTEKVTGSTSRTERRVFSNFIQNGKNGLYVNIKSKTPDNEKTLNDSYNKNYIHIDFNDEIRNFLHHIYENFNPEHKVFRLDNDYNYEEIINSYQRKGFIKCEANPTEFVKDSFFSHVVKKRGKKVLEPLTTTNFNFDKITEAIYILNFSGCWRRQEMEDGDYITKASGIKINVMGVIVKKYISPDEEYIINEKKRREDQLAEVLRLINEESEEDETT